MKSLKTLTYFAPDLRRLSCRIECGFAASVAIDDDSSTEKLEWD